MFIFTGGERGFPSLFIFIEGERAFPVNIN